MSQTISWFALTKPSAWSVTFLLPLLWPIYFIISAGKTKFRTVLLPTLRDTTVSEENNFFLFRLTSLSRLELCILTSVFFPMYPQLLTEQKATPEHASNLLDKLFNTPDPKRDPVILLVDEVRACTTRKRTIRSVLFCVCYRQCQHCWNIRTILLAILRAMFFQHRPWIVVRSLTRKKSGKQYPGILGLNFVSHCMSAVFHFVRYYAWNDHAFKKNVTIFQ